MKTKHQSAIMPLVAVAVLAAAGFLQSAPLVHEPFAYPAGNLHGASGSSEAGLAGTWDAKVESANSTVVGAGSLDGKYASSGGSVGPLSGGVNKYGGSRAVSASALAANGLLDDGATLWLGVVMGYGPGANATNARLAVALANDNFSAGNYDYWIRNDGTQLGSGVGMVLGRFSVNGRVLPVRFRDLASGDGFAGNVNGVWTGNGTVLGVNQYAMYVAEITWGATPGDPDTIKVYQPDADLNPGAPISTLTDIFVDQSSFDTLTFARGDVVVLDEIRMGATYADVVPADVTAPALVSARPSGTEGLLPLEVVFDERIQAGGGDIRIFNTTGPALVGTIPIDDEARVSIDGTRLTITPDMVLAIGQSYYVEMDAGTVTDSAGNGFAGISGPAVWSFTLTPLSFPDDDTDGDGLTNAAEHALGTDPLVGDTDADGLNDGEEVSLGTNPLLVDSDGDGFNDFMEVQSGSDPLDGASVPLDSDGDGLDDGWEITHFGDLSHDGTADSDGDLLTDACEFQLGLDPVVADSDGDGLPDWMGIPGYLYVEQWNGIPGATLEDLFASGAFYGGPDEVYLVPQAKARSNVGDNYGLRMSGRVTAPVTGDYRFWLAGDGQCELFLSTDAGVFNRRSIATVAVGTGVNQWNAETGQKSAPVGLVAGREYYLEVLMKEGEGADHVEVGWSYPGQNIQIIPAASLRSFVADPGDADGDGLPDAWETQVGLDPADNGAADRWQSAFADIDGDGLRNFEEYLYGGDPQVVGGQRGYLEFDRWMGVEGTDLQAFLEGSDYAGAADLRTWTGADVPPPSYTYGGRLRGTVTAPETGLYTFWIAGDNAAELWLSPTDSRFAKRRIAASPEPKSYQNWLTRGAQQSAGIRLTKGCSYFIEALVKNVGVGGHVSIGWSYVPDSQWSTADIGLSPTAWAEQNGTVTGSVTGGEIGNGADSFGFRYFPLEGDGELIARIDPIIAVGTRTQVGLMVREALDAGSMNAMMVRNEDGRLIFQHRDAGGGPTEATFPTIGVPYKWIRIKRKGEVLTGYYSLDGKTWKSQGTCSITMNRTAYAGLAIAELSAGGGVGASWSDISIAKQSQIEVVPSSVLTSVLPDPNDSDDDNLPDTWEVFKGLNASTAAGGMGQYGDPDGDHLTNYEEYLLGSDPLQAAPVPGYLTRENWSGVNAPIHEFVRSAGMLAGPGTRELLGGTEYNNFEVHAYGQRVRGKVVAPVTGNYRFWISGDRDFELWLSGSSSKFHKRKIASMLQEDVGNAVGVDFREWDRYSSQMSEPLFLEAGQEYYLEILHQDNLAPGHFSVAWCYTDQQTGVTTEREPIPAARLRSYMEDPDDADDDCLPDSWETATGLNPLDNGLSDLAREGEYGDYDGDLLTNREEWLAGSDPTKADTDGDGMSDYDEVRFYHSDPASPDSSAEQLVATVPVQSVAGLGGAWIDTGAGVMAASFRDDGTWNFTVPTAGFWVLRVDLKLLGDLDDVEVLPVRTSIDGTGLGRTEAVFRDGGPGFIRVFSSYLTQGTHELNLFFDNYMARRSVVVTGISVLSPAGADPNGNASSDLIENLLREGGTISEHTVVESYVSPFFIEGHSRSLDLFELRTAHEGPGSTIRHKDSYWDKEIPKIQLARDSAVMGITANPGSDRSAAGDVQGVNPGPGSTTWYTGLALTPNEATGYTAFFENGALARSGVVVWRPVNLFDADEITIPAGSELLMGAWESETDNSDLDFSIDGTALPRIKALDAVSRLFDSPGDYTVTVLHAKSGTTQSLTVRVEGADLQPDILLSENNSRIVRLPEVEPHLVLDADGEISIGPLAAATTGGSDVRLGGLFPGCYRTAVRMQPYGPILDIEPVTVVGVSDAQRNGNNLVIPYDGDIVRVVSTLLVTNLPPGGTIIINIFAAGVTFMDGTTRKSFTAADLDEHGVLVLEMLMPRERVGAPCHNVWIEDADGLRIFSTST